MLFTSAMDALQEAIALFPTAADLAREAGVSPQVINNALRRGSVSPELALAIEQATGGKIRKDRLVWGDKSEPNREAA